MTAAFGSDVLHGGFLLRADRGAGLTAGHAFRQELGRNLRLTLEILIGADIIWTVAVERTFTSLGLLVFVRTSLSFALTSEVTGRWPWQAAEKAPSGH